MINTSDLEIQKLTEEIAYLKAELKNKEKQLFDLRCRKNSDHKYSSKFSSEEITRYSRQMLVPSIGIKGQEALKKSKIVIIGAGGLGCPAALYLAAAGVGQITIIDNDEVDLTNLHRQILHSENSLKVSKVDSAFITLTSINSNVEIIPIHMHIDGASLQRLLQETKYDVVIDGTDNVATRYLLNDMCVLNKIPLVSGSALQLEGQLTVYNYNGGLCYRCLFPIPPPPNTVTSCGDGGVLGVVPGVIGILEALEAIKIVTKMPGVLSGQLLLFDGAETVFRNIKLRTKKLDCDVCGTNPTITGPIDYEQFCSSKAHDKVENIDILNCNENVNVLDLTHFDKDNMLLDVRPSIEYDMCHLPNSINLPYSEIEREEELNLQAKLLQKFTNLPSNVYVICRRGNDSQRAIHILKNKCSKMQLTFINVKGGLYSYSKSIDASFPIY